MPSSPSDFFNSLGSRFIAGGDYNAKHTVWGSGLISPKGRALLKTLKTLNLSHISSGSPTYWPSDCTKTPDLIDFCISKGIPPRLVVVESSLELSSDHTPVVITLSKMAYLKERPAALHSKNTNWSIFKNIVSNEISPNLPLKTE